MSATALEQIPVNTETGMLATFWTQETDAGNAAGNVYWRCKIPARYLPGVQHKLWFDDLKPHGSGIVMPRQRGPAAIWQFPGNASKGILMRSMQLAGFRVLVEVDDNYLISPPQVPRPRSQAGQVFAALAGIEWVPEKPDWTPRIDRKVVGDSYTIEGHRALCEFADGIIVTTETLATAYRDVNDHVFVCRNSVDAMDWPEPDKPTDGIFRVGYAASHSHYFDAADVQRALSYAAHQPGVEVVMFGLDPGWSFPYRHVPWTVDLPAYQRSLQQLDVGLCPLRPGLWADSKSDIKLMEYALSGAASVVARRPPYSEWHDTDLALTADTAKEFLKHVRWCVRNQDGVREMAARAKTHVLAERTIETEIPRWREAVCAA